MSYRDIITEETGIYQYLQGLNFLLYFTKPVLRHIQEFMTAAVQKGYKGTVTDMVALSFANCHRTTFGRFLKKGIWKAAYIWKAVQKEAVNWINTMSKVGNEPVFVIWDDTIAEKTKPSSQALNPIEAAGFHHSHTENKSVWGHQLLAVMLSCGICTLPYLLERYVKGAKSKIQMVCDIVSSIPTFEGRVYGLCDSWFTNKKVIDAHLSRDFHLIGALKTNRIIYPKGINISIRDFAQYIEKNDVHLVTVNNSQYWVYRYEGHLNGIENAVVLLCWPKSAFKKEPALHAFLCTDMELDSQTILEYYSKRWPIEIFFRQTKGLLGLNKYQVRSTAAIDRILALIALTYLFCTTQKSDYCKLSEGIVSTRREIHKQGVIWIYQQAKDDVPIDNVLFCLKAA